MEKIVEIVCSYHPSLEIAENYKDNIKINASKDKDGNMTELVITHLRTS